MSPEAYHRARQAFDGVYGLYLVSVDLLPDLMLRVTVDEAGPEPDTRPVATGSADVDRALAASRAVTTRAGHRRFVVEFDPVMHAVTDESFMRPGAEEDFTSPLRRRETSPFIDWAQSATYTLGHADSGPLSHISLVTYDVVIDVLTRSAPSISVTDLTQDASPPL